ncbi:winged helix-turn-helix transcriptional regulator [Williamsia phyllosphaerae]|uniref:Transcriptional regulator n=1 Tax=Williamsia phyllosphaerae TaxID=885042 RepID=A0ABQ1V391_9NOCA|nr:helix-turn-helix domain-containing protein [Williamsia phyllosphaerae]GGF36958.1 transcriptional regulator [Williamsia phyllosphaerae]
MATTARSACPLNMSLELVGDRWTLLILRDMIFRDRRQFRELLANSAEGIASNVLATRLESLVDADVLTKAPHLGHKQKIVYSLTDRGVDLLPVMIQLGAWGATHTSSPAPIAQWFRIAAAAGPEVWQQLTDELRARHRDQHPADPSVEPTFTRLAAEFRAAAAAKRPSAT